MAGQSSPGALHRELYMRVAAECASVPVVA